MNNRVRARLKNVFDQVIDQVQKPGRDVTATNIVLIDEHFATEDVEQIAVSREFSSMDLPRLRTGYFERGCRSLRSSC